jgi:hypothetical protein
MRPMQRPNEREFLQEVLKEIEDLPLGLADRLLEVFDRQAGDRAEALRKLFEEFGRG